MTDSHPGGNGRNPYVPYLAKIESTLDLTYDVRLFRVRFNDPAVEEAFVYKPGQFAVVSAFGVGESPFDICSLHQADAPLEFAIRRVGTVTSGLHSLEAGDVVGIRGPFGNWFPMEECRGKDILVIGGGIGMAPMRSVVNWVVDHRSDYGALRVLNGARSPQDLVFTNEFDLWRSSPNSELVLTVDRGDAEWKDRVALIPAVVTELNYSPDNSVAFVCGPPIMIKFTVKALKELGFQGEQIVTTLESKMKCGIGKCGRCNIGQSYVCLDGPVYTFAQASHLLEEL
ncbi:MAG TPA: FAD/NAD(P)-binding protein [Dehalococcoidia bacterium]|nr:FAD/NAD(P)-binding protein [Dehalococcoidia bacterium]